MTIIALDERGGKKLLLLLLDGSTRAEQYLLIAYTRVTCACTVRLTQPACLSAAPSTLQSTYGDADRSSGVPQSRIHIRHLQRVADIVFQSCNFLVVLGSKDQQALAGVRIGSDGSGLIGVFAAATGSKDQITDLVIAQGVVLPIVGQIGSFAYGRLTKYLPRIHNQAYPSTYIGIQSLFEDLV